MGNGIRGINALSRLEIFKWAIFMSSVSKLEYLVLHKEIRNGSTLFTFKQIKNINLKDILRLTEEDAFHLLKNSPLGKPW